MQLTAQTTHILRNFANIHQSLFIPAGDTIMTISPDGGTIAKAKLEENFPRDFAVYDMVKFLGIYTLMGSPDLIFYDNHLVFSSDNKKVSYVYANELVKRFDKKIKLPEVQAKISISQEDLKTLRKSASVMGLESIVFKTVEGKVAISAENTKNSSTGSFVIQTDFEGTSDLNVVVNLQNLKIIDDDYDVEITEDVIHLVNKQGSMEYWVVAYV